MKVTTVFQSLFERSVRIDPAKATKDVVSTSDQVNDFRVFGIEVPVVMQEAIRVRLFSILSDQINLNGGNSYDQRKFWNPQN